MTEFSPILSPDLAEAQKFLSALDPKAPSWTFQTFDDNADRKDNQLARVLHGTLAQHAPALIRLQEQGAGVFVTINETDGLGREKKNIIRVRAVFVDLDGPPVDPVRKWESPHIITQSSPEKWHCYWLVNDCPLDRFKGLQKALIDAFEGDTSVHDLPRVMRLPGFFHLKVEKAKGLDGTPRMVRLIETDAFPAPFGLAEFEAKLAAIPVRHSAPERAATGARSLSAQAMPQGPRGGAMAPTGGFSIDTGDDLQRTRAGLPEVREILSHISPAVGYADWLAVLMGLHDHFGGSAEGLALADEWSVSGPTYQTGLVAEKWGGFTPGGGAGLGTVCNLARQHGADLSAIARRHRGASRSAPSGAAPGAGVEKRGTGVKWCAEVACATLETHAQWKGALAFDEFTGLTMLLQPIPGTTTPRATFKPRPICDNDFTAALRWFNRNGFPDATRNTVGDAVYLVAAHSIISPVRHYLESLSWDGVSRVAHWLLAYCGAAPSDLTQNVGRAWLVSAVARALQPGCKADCALVMEGRQGAGKSSVLRALAGDDWFHDGLSDMHGKDASAALKGKWIIELPELSAMRRTDTEAVKAFLSRTEERYRPAYGRAEVVEPRRCVFAGTTNRSDYLTDDTGGRRFWPVAVGSIALADLKRDRDQLWAEAVDLYRSGAQWWLDDEAEKEAAAVVSDRAADDPWTADVLGAVLGVSECSTRDIFERMEILIDRRGAADGKRISGILTRAGWRQDGRYTGGINKGLTRWRRPAVKDGGEGAQNSPAKIDIR